MTTSPALAMVLLGVCAAAAFFLTTTTAAAAAAAVCHQNSQQNQTHQHLHHVPVPVIPVPGGGGSGEDDLVATACEKAKGHEAHHYRGLGLRSLTRPFCEATLRSDTRSAAANDTRELALVAMDLAGAAASAAFTKARSALRSSSSAVSGGNGGGGRVVETELSLRYCVMDYATVRVVLPACRAVVEEYAAGDFQAPFDYLECAGRVMDAAGDCWRRVSFEDGDLRRAMWKDAVDVANRANLAQALVEQMVDFVPDEQE